LFKNKESLSSWQWISYRILILCFLLLSSYGFIFGLGGTAKAASKDTGWQLLINGKGVTLYPHQETQKPLDPPENTCIDVQVSLSNPTVNYIRAQLGFFNNCGRGLSKTYWSYNTTIFCGPGLTPGPKGTAHNPLIVSKGQALSVFDEEGRVTCLHNGVPVSWSAEGAGSVTGIIAGTTNAGTGSDVELITGF
jgi:hypothetical protein